MVSALSQERQKLGIRHLALIDAAQQFGHVPVHPHLLDHGMGEPVQASRTKPLIASLVIMLLATFYKRPVFVFIF